MKRVDIIAAVIRQYEGGCNGDAKLAELIDDAMQELAYENFNEGYDMGHKEGYDEGFNEGYDMGAKLGAGLQDEA